TQEARTEHPQATSRERLHQDQNQTGRMERRLPPLPPRPYAIALPSPGRTILPRQGRGIAYGNPFEKGFRQRLLKGRRRWKSFWIALGRWRIRGRVIADTISWS